MSSSPAIFARGPNTIVKNRNNEGKQKLLTLSHEDRTGFPVSLWLVMLNGQCAAFVLS